MIIRLLRIATWFALVCATGDIHAQAPALRLGAAPSRSRAADSLAIRAAIERGARGFERAEPESILTHYAPDVILSYPGLPDQDYAALVRGYGELRDRPSTVMATTVPTFDEILVRGDLAVVRVRWTTTIRSAATPTSEARASTRYLRDLQVWRRDPDGEWRFIRGMHYRDSTAAPQPSATLPAPPAAARARLTASPRHSELVSIPVSAADTMRAWVTYPERRERAPVVVVLHELFGLTTWIRGIGDQLAAQGFIAIVPDLFSAMRFPMHPDSLEADHSRLDSIAEFMRALNYGVVVRRMEAAGRYGAALPASNGRWGVMGFCWGGTMALVAVANAPSVSAAVVWYGGAERARVDLTTVRAPTLGLFGEADARVNTTIPYIAESYRAAGARFESRMFAGAGHGFLRELEGRGGANLAASRAAWPAGVEWLREHLGADSIAVRR